MSSFFLSPHVPSHVPPPTVSSRSRQASQHLQHLLILPQYQMPPQAPKSLLHLLSSPGARWLPASKIPSNHIKDILQALNLSRSSFSQDCLLPSTRKRPHVVGSRSTNTSAARARLLCHQVLQCSSLPCHPLVSHPIPSMPSPAPRLLHNCLPHSGYECSAYPHPSRYYIRL